jgi:hypothetical protein
MIAERATPQVWTVVAVLRHQPGQPSTRTPTRPETAREKVGNGRELER